MATMRRREHDDAGLLRGGLEEVEHLRGNAAGAVEREDERRRRRGLDPGA